MRLKNYTDKFDQIAPRLGVARLVPEDQSFVRELAHRHRFTQQELRQVIEIASDFSAWKEPSIRAVWPELPGISRAGKKQALAALRHHRDTIRGQLIDYDQFGPDDKPETVKPRLVAESKASLGLGKCPVASSRTRCCNLMTLDAVESCGFDCSYCSIQSFYNEDRVVFDRNFAEKLSRIVLDPNQTYHIGTGQSSDSLMWGNKFGVLDAVMGFARRNPNVILELKTKSRNIKYLLEHDIPANVVCTWSLNTPAVINAEEHLTASLDDRLRAARDVADRGIVVGFHFHPMIQYRGWEREYGKICATLTGTFSSDEVAMVSIGTLTFIKPVISRLRQRGLHSKVLQIPMVDADGKQSYPDAVKLELFQSLYASLSDWHGEVFFYLCMENARLWKPVFGYDFKSNEEFERSMKESYLGKIHRCETRRVGRDCDATPAIREARSS